MGKMSEDLQFVLHENKIHEFIFLKPSRTAVDELYQVFIEYVESGDPPKSFLLLIDARNGIVPPLRYLFTATQEFAARYETVPPGHTAILHNPNMIVSLLENFMNTLSRFVTGYNTLKFFNEDKREEAIAWLLDQASSGAHQT